MSWIAVAGVAVTAVGSAVSASGAAKSAAAIGDANAANAQREQDLYDRQQKAINQLSNQKENKLSNLGNIFDRMESTGAFGDTNTLKNLRKAQADYSALAAGDFSGFESQLRQSLSDSLIATAGAGAPIGTFAGLAAQDQLKLRGQGIQTSMGISDYLSTEAYKLLGNEFGIMDQKFEVGYKLDRDKTTNFSQYALGQAATEGVAMTAYGNAGQQIGSSIIGAYNNYQNRQTIQQSNANQLQIAQMAYGQQSPLNRQTINPTTGLPTYFDTLGQGFNNGSSGSSVGSNLSGSFPSVSNYNDIPLPNSNVTSGLDPYGNGLLPPSNNGLTVYTPGGATTFQGSNSGFMNAYNTWGNNGVTLLSKVGSGIVGQ